MSKTFVYLTFATQNAPVCSRVLAKHKSQVTKVWTARLEPKIECQVQAFLCS